MGKRWRCLDLYQKSCKKVVDILSIKEPIYRKAGDVSVKTVSAAKCVTPIEATPGKMATPVDAVVGKMAVTKAYVEGVNVSPVKVKEAKIKSPVSPKEATFKEAVSPKEAVIKEAVSPKEVVIKEGLSPKDVNVKSAIPSDVILGEEKNVAKDAYVREASYAKNTGFGEVTPTENPNFFTVDEKTAVDAEIQNPVYEELVSKLKNARPVDENITVDQLFNGGN